MSFSCSFFADRPLGLWHFVNAQTKTNCTQDYRGTHIRTGEPTVPLTFCFAFHGCPWLLFLNQTAGGPTKSDFKEIKEIIFVVL